MQDIVTAFIEPRNATHRQYEALRAFFVDGIPQTEIYRIPLLPTNPKDAFVKRYSMFSVFPLNISVPQFFKFVFPKTSSKS